MARVRYRFGGRLRVWPHFGTVFGVFALGAFAALGQAPIDAWYVTILAFSLIFFILTFAENSLAAGLLGFGAGLGYFAASGGSFEGQQPSQLKAFSAKSRPLQPALRSP